MKMRKLKKKTTIVKHVEKCRKMLENAEKGKVIKNVEHFGKKKERKKRKRKKRKRKKKKKKKKRKRKRKRTREQGTRNKDQENKRTR